MMRPVEAVVFLSLATGLHVGAWSVTPGLRGASAEAGAGLGSVTLAAAAPRHESLARAWQAPPTLGADAGQPAANTPAETRPDIPRSDSALPTLPPAPKLAALLPSDLPKAETEPPAARPVPVPETPAQPKAATPDNRTAAPAAADAAPGRPAPPQPPQMTPDTAARADTLPPPAPQDAPKPKARPSQPATPQALAGNGGASAKPQAGRGGKDETQSLGAASRNALQATWGAQIQRKVHRNLIYPRGVTGSGTAKVALTVDRGGRLTGLRLIRSSGVAKFDDAALNAVRRAGRFVAAPEALTDASYTFTLSLAFRP